MKDANSEDLLIKGSSWTIHENNIHTLLTVNCNPINPPIMQAFFI